MEKKNFESLYLQEDDSINGIDILVKTKTDTWRFPAHRITLAAASDEFSEMLSYKSEEDGIKSIVIEDSSPEIISKILRYIYVGEIEFDHWSEVCDILRTAHKYSLSPLLKECEKYLNRALTLRNVCYVLNLAHLCDLNELKTECLSLCRSGAFVVLKTRGFLSLDPDIVKQMISLDLNAASEVDVLLALWDWSQMRCCKQRQHLTKERITEEFLQFSDLFRLESVSEADLSCLPESVSADLRDRKKCRLREKDESQLKDLKRFEICKSGSTVPRSLVKSANPLQIPPRFFSESKFTSSDKHERIQIIPKIPLLSFSLDINAYLVDFKLVNFEDKHETSYIEKIVLLSNGKIVAKWSNDQDELQLTFEKNKQRTEYVFTAKSLFFLKADQEYRLELFPVSHCPQLCEIRWPKTQFVKTKERFLSERVTMKFFSCTWGIYRMTFLRAS